MLYYMKKSGPGAPALLIQDVNKWDIVGPGCTVQHHKGTIPLPMFTGTEEIEEDRVSEVLSLLETMPRSRPVDQDLYAVLGVPSSADQDEIRRAYLGKIKEAHPDLNPDTGDEQAKRINAAYDALSDPEKRGQHNRDSYQWVCPDCGAVLHGTESAAEHILAHTEGVAHGGVCQVCRRTPAAHFSFTSNTGMILMRSVKKFEGNLCKACARGMYRHMQTHNLTWGGSVISFFYTLYALIENATSYLEGRSGLTNPVPSLPEAEKRLAGRPIWQRMGLRLSVPAVIVGIIVLIGNLSGGAGTHVSTNNYAKAIAATTTTQPPQSAGTTQPSRNAETSLLTWVDGFDTLLQQRNQVVDVQNQRMQAAGDGADRELVRNDLVVDEVAALKAKVDAYSLPTDGTLSPLFEAWRNRVGQWLDSQTALAQLDTSENRDAGNFYGTKEGEALDALIAAVKAKLD